MKNKEEYSIITKNRWILEERIVTKMKIGKYITIILLMTFLLLSFSANYSRTNAAALSNIVSGADGFIQNGQGSSKIDNDDIHNLSDSLYNILLIIGTVIAMTGSIEVKSKVKESLIPYVVGCVVIFGAFGIWKLAITILQGIG